MQRSRRDATQSPRLSAQQLNHGAVRLVDCRVGISRSAGIRVADGDAAKARPADHVRTLRFWHVGIEQRVVFGRIAVWPAIHGYRLDVTRRIESSGPQRAQQLLADIALKGRKRCRQQLCPARLVLRVLVQTRLARRARQVQQRGLLGARRTGYAPMSTLALSLSVV